MSKVRKIEEINQSIMFLEQYSLNMEYPYYIEVKDKIIELLTEFKQALEELEELKGKVELFLTMQEPKFNAHDLEQLRKELCRLVGVNDE